MKKLTIALLAAVFAVGGPSLKAAATEEQEQVHEAAMIMRRFHSMPEKEIPREVLRDAKGLAILKVVKGGFIWSGKVGEGVVVARNRHGWSGPAFIRTGGIGFGAQIGGEVSQIVLVLNTNEAVRAFEQGTNVELGGALSVAAGPLGRTAEAGVMPKAAVYSYSLSKGLFAGASLEGTAVDSNDKANARYYGGPVSAGAILRGKVGEGRARELIASL